MKGTCSPKRFGSPMRSPRAVMLENVRGFLDPSFEDYRKRLFQSFRKLGYKTDIKLFNASDYGVPQLRPRIVIVALRSDDADHFTWPEKVAGPAPTVGDTLVDRWQRTDGHRPSNGLPVRKPWGLPL